MNDKEMATVVLKIGAARHDVCLKDAESHWRDPRAVRARWFAFNALRERGWSLPRIARAFNRDHTTVIYGLRRFKEEEDERNIRDNFAGFSSSR